MEDLSTRCIKINADAAPSVSYLSMIERGKRVPSEEMLDVIAQVFQKKPEWFLDDMPEEDAITPEKGRRGGINGIALEPSFLFSKDILQIAIPEMLSQTGTSGRQFAQLLIRAYQEHHQNHFPDLERAAEEVGAKKMPLSIDDILDIVKSLKLKIQWFDKIPDLLQADFVELEGAIVSSFFDPPNTIYLNKILQVHQRRLKYDLAVHVGHCVLHNREGLRSVLIAGHSATEAYGKQYSSAVDSQDILHAWRDFESRFFAGALLCPKVPFRQLLDRHGYEVNLGHQVDVSISTGMRRMTAVSPYPYWHYFDAYSPGKLKAVYRGNGIPLPWGNMRMVEDPCQHWAVFRMLNSMKEHSSAQISILHVDNEPRIYCCESINVKDIAGNNHVLCSGVDLNPALDTQSGRAAEISQDLKQACVKGKGSAAIPKGIAKEILTLAKILNINWLERGIGNDARLICSRGSQCPRSPSCY